MGFQMLMRVTGAISPYKEALQKLVEMPGETLILSTGYADYDILNNNPNFIDLVHKGLYDKNLQKKGTEIIILGGKFKHNHPLNQNSKYYVCDSNTKLLRKNCNSCSPYYCHQYKFEKFVNDMNLLLKNKKYAHKLRFFRALNDDFHAKIAMKLYKGTPIAAIVGSSNLTKPAFNDNYNFFNHEADMFIWNGRVLKGTSLQGFKGITTKDYTKDYLENIYAGKCKC